MLLLASVFFYIFFKLVITNVLLQGFLLNAAVSGIDFTFKLLTVYFVKRENRKYKQDHDKSLMTKLASFKFINIHLPIVFALIDFKLRPSKLLPEI